MLYLGPFPDCDARQQLRLMFRKSLIFFLIAVFCTLQVSAGIASTGECISNPTGPVHDHKCCCPEKEPCCCDLEQGSPSQPSDMALNATSGGGFDDAPRLAGSDMGVQNLFPVQNHQAPRVHKDTGPPLTSFYLTNLTFRC